MARGYVIKFLSIFLSTFRHYVLTLSLEVEMSDDQIKYTVTFTTFKIYLGLNIVGNIWDNESKQLKIQDKGQAVFTHFDAETSHIISKFKFNVPLSCNYNHSFGLCPVSQSDSGTY